MGERLRSYKDLKVWQLSMEVAYQVFRLTAHFPKEQRYVLAAQMQRSAISVASNIAEGSGRRGKVEFRRFLKIAMGSLAELETQYLLARRLGFLGGSWDELGEKLDEVGRMCVGLLRSLKEPRWSDR